MPMSNSNQNSLPLPLRLLLIVLLATMAVGLAYAVLSLPEQAPGLSEYTDKNLDISGVINPVTAVLLNYRAYDTFLELGVLLLALIGVWSLGSSVDRQQPASGPILDNLTQMLVPLLIMVAGYLLWAGAHAPGGAFQAGAVLGAAGVLLLLTGWRISAALAGMVLRVGLVMGLVVFAVVGVILIFPGGQFLVLPPAYAGAVILLIETVATLSIAISLVALFLGGEPELRPNQPSGQQPEQKNDQKHHQESHQERRS